MATYHPTLEALKRLSGRARTAPVVQRLLADQMTPVGVFAKLSEGADHAFLLESVVGGERIARYSFVGARPATVFRARRDIATIERADGTMEVISDCRDPLATLDGLVRQWQTPPHGKALPFSIPLPRFTGGAVGFAGYDTIRYYEQLARGNGVKSKSQNVKTSEWRNDETGDGSGGGMVAGKNGCQGPVDDRGLDDLLFGIYDEMVIFDHANKTLLVVAHAQVDTGDIAAAYDDACRRIDRIVSRLSTGGQGLAGEFDLDARSNIAFESTFTQPTFEAAVRAAKEYILAGDIFQVVLSQRLRVHAEADPFNVYRALRVVNPSPFMFYVKSPKCVLVGASPEILCRVEDGVVTNRPLAGTRRRGATAEEDAALERELLADPKDRAEHIMLVDLGRNDVGRVAAPGSVKLSEVMSVERYSHVMHISSNVTGRLAPGRTAVDALRAALPVGTVSGAPKIRAMQIIDELEPVRRGPYGGAVGYLDFSGNMDTCIALRTMVITPPDPSHDADQRPVHKGGVCSDSPTGRSDWIYDIQAGAGIVMDSDPAAEFEETMNKAKAMLAAVGMVLS